MKSLKWLLISSLAVSYVMVGSGSKTIHAEHNNIEFIQIKEGETIPLYKLKGTSLEGKEVKIIGDKLFVDGQKRAAGAIAVFIAGILAGYFIDGILIYTTGYSGGELCAQGLTALKNFGNRNASKVYFNTNKSTYVYSYITKDGQQCTRAPSGTQYVCAYSG